MFCDLCSYFRHNEGLNICENKKNLISQGAKWLIQTPDWCPLPKKYRIGDIVVDEDGNTGIVIIKWNDGDLCAIENDAAHPNPKITGHWKGD